MSVNMQVKCYFPLSEFHPCLYASNHENGKTFTKAVSILKKVLIMQFVYAHGGFSQYPLSIH